jgi:hypothetical protein
MRCLTGDDAKRLWRNPLYRRALDQLRGERLISRSTKATEQRENCNDDTGTGRPTTDKTECGCRYLCVRHRCKSDRGENGD